MAAVTICSEPKKRKSATASPSICHEVMGPDSMIFVFWMLSFKPAFSFSSFTFIKKFFSSCLLFAIIVVSSAYLRLFIFLPSILIPTCVSSSPPFLMMYSAYKLNKQGDNTQPWSTPLPTWNQSVVPCPVLNVASLQTYRFLRRQVRWSGILLKNFPQFVGIHAVKGFWVVNKADVFFWKSLAFSMTQQMLVVWSLVPLPFLNLSWTSGSFWFTYCWSLTCRILSIILIACKMRVIVQQVEHSLALPLN